MTTVGRNSGRGARAHVALLRGVNVGGRHRLPMKTLSAVFEEAGCTDVETVRQSGNVVFHAADSVRRRLPGRIEAALADRLGFEVPVVLRSAEAMARVAAHHPLDGGFVEAKTLHVGFCMRAPTVTQAGRVDPERSPPDRVVVQGAEIYLCCPRGMARTKLTSAYLDRVLETTVTIRSWRVVGELARRASASVARRP